MSSYTHSHPSHHFPHWARPLLSHFQRHKTRLAEKAIIKYQVWILMKLLVLWSILLLELFSLICCFSQMVHSSTWHEQCFYSWCFQEDLYMQQLPGFISHDPKLVYKLHQAIYGLKQPQDHGLINSVKL